MLALERVPQSMDEPIQGGEGELRALLGSVNDRERMILRAHYGLDGPEQSLRDIGERIGLSAERVRQIEQRAPGKLKAAADRGERD